MGLYDDVLLTVDFDRTLTAPDSSIPQRNLDAIRYFMENGGSFTVNTGRSVPMFIHKMDLIPHNAPWLLYNGSAAYDNGQLFQMHPLTIDRKAILQKLHDRYPRLSVEEQGVDAHYTFWDDKRWHELYDAVGCCHKEVSLDQEIGPFLKFSILGKARDLSVADMYEATEEEMAEFNEVEQWLRDTLAGSAEVFRACPRIIDVHTNGVSKIRAARELQEALGKKILVCVGDAENDIPMLDGADYAFCPCDGVVADRYENVCKCADGAVAEVIYEKIPRILKIKP